MGSSPFEEEVAVESHPLFLNCWSGHCSTDVGVAVVRLAERVGFEPTVELPRQQFSRLPDSAALAPLRSRLCRSSGGMDLGGLSESIGASLPWGRRIFNWFSSASFTRAIAPRDKPPPIQFGKNILFFLFLIQLSNDPVHCFKTFLVCRMRSIQVVFRRRRLQHLQPSKDLAPFS
jgi:hypothetical protein